MYDLIVEPWMTLRLGKGLVAGLTIVMATVCLAQPNRQAQQQADAQRQAQARQQADAQRQAQARQQADAQRQAQARQQADAQRQAQARQQADANRQAQARQQQDAQRRSIAQQRQAASLNKPPKPMAVIGRSMDTRVNPVVNGLNRIGMPATAYKGVGPQRQQSLGRKVEAFKQTRYPIEFGRAQRSGLSGSQAAAVAQARVNTQGTRFQQAAFKADNRRWIQAAGSAGLKGTRPFPLDAGSPKGLGRSQYYEMEKRTLQWQKSGDPRGNTRTWKP